MLAGDTPLGAGAAPRAGETLLALLAHPCGGGKGPPWGTEALPAATGRDLLDLARAHGVSPYLYHRLEENDQVSLLPSALAEELAADFRWSVGRYLVSRHQLREAARIARQVGATLYLFKGLSLAERYYPHPGARAAGDVDILVSRGGAGLLREAAAGQGVNLAGCEIEEDHHDLHTRVYPVDLEELWRRSHPWSVEGETLRVPSPEHALLIQCLTCCRRGFWNLRFLLDVREILRSYGDALDTAYLVRCAETWGLTCSLATSIQLAESFFGPSSLDLPLRAMEPAGARGFLWRGLMSRARPRIVGARGGEARRVPVGDHLLRHLVVPPRLWGRQLMWDLLWPTWLGDRNRYPGVPAPLVPVVRIAHGLVMIPVGLGTAVRQILSARQSSRQEGGRTQAP